MRLDLSVRGILWIKLKEGAACHLESPRFLSFFCSQARAKTEKTHSWMSQISRFQAKNRELVD